MAKSDQDLIYKIREFVIDESNSKTLIHNSFIVKEGYFYSKGFLKLVTFLEEKLRLFSHEKNRKIFKEQIFFILKICNKKWFKRREDIIYDELVNNYRHKNYEFVKKN